MADISISKYTTQVIRVGSTPSSPGFAVDEGQDPVDPSGNPQTHLPVTIAAAADGFSITDAQVLSGAGTTAQYIRGNGSLATFPSLTGFVPYTGATADVDLGTHDLTAERGTFTNNGSSDTLTVNHTSGSGYGIIVTKGGNNEALYVSKTSGSGNAMTVVGGRTSLVDLSLSSVSNATGNFLTISGNVVHQRTAAQTLTDIGGQAALTNPVTGTGTTNFLPKFTGASTIGNSIVSDNGSRILINTGTTNQNTTINASKIAMSRTSDGAEVVYFSKNTDLGSEGTANINGYDGIQFRTQGAESVKATLNASGILGVGVTPSAWNLYKAIQVQNASISNFDNSDNSIVGSNVFYGGSPNDFRYISTGTSTVYRLNNSVHSWFTAPSGTAGAAISFTQAMTLGSNSGLSIGTPSAAPSQGLLVQGSIVAGLQGGNIQLKGATDGFVGVNASNTLFLTDWATATKGLQINLLTGAATFSSSVSTPHTTKSADYTLDATDYTVGFDCASNRTATLPDATTCAGRIYVIYQYNTGTGGSTYVTLDGNGSQTIDGVTTYSLQYNEDFSSVMIQSTGSNWVVIAYKLYPSPL